MQTLLVSIRNKTTDIDICKWNYIRYSNEFSNEEILIGFSFTLKKKTGSLKTFKLIFEDQSN